MDRPCSWSPREQKCMLADGAGTAGSKARTKANRRSTSTDQQSSQTLDHRDGPCTAGSPAAPDQHSLFIHPRSVLDRVLIEQQSVQEQLLPTPTNINPIHLPRDDLLAFVRVQQWVRDNLHINLPLLNGMFVLVPSAALLSDPDSIATASVIPWRLRQVLSVEVPADASSDPQADATLVLVGGDRVAAGTVRPGTLAAAGDYEHLCCELADLQQRGQLRQLQVFDVAHMVWRMKVACELDGLMHTLQQQEPAAGCHLHGAETSGCAARLDGARSLLRQLPPTDWVQGQILPCIVLNGVNPVPQSWQDYLQLKLSGQQPKPAAALLPCLGTATERETASAPQNPCSCMDAVGGVTGLLGSGSDQQLPRSNSPRQSRAPNNPSGGGHHDRQGRSRSSSKPPEPSATHSQSDGCPRSLATSCEEGGLSGAAGTSSGCSDSQTRSHTCDMDSYSHKCRSSRSRSRSPVTAQQRRGLSRRSPAVNSPQLRRGLCRSAAPASNTRWYRDSTPSLEDQPDGPAEDMEQQVQAWMQQLAVKVSRLSGPPPPPGQHPHCIRVSWLKRVHPLPPNIQRHYKSFSKFISKRPQVNELQGKSGGGLKFFLQPR